MWKWAKNGDTEVLQACLEAAWESLPQEQLDRLEACLSVVDAKGEATPH